MDRAAIEIALQAAMAELRVAWGLLRELPPARPRRVQTLSDSLDEPRLDSVRPPKDAETMVTCKCCHIGLVPPAEMERWSRRDGPPDS